MPTVDPSRGTVLGAGGVLLATAVGLLQARLEQPWSNGVHFIVALAAFALVFSVAYLSPLPERPLAYQSTLALAGLALLTFVLFRLAQVLGVDQPFGNSGTVLWMSALFAGVAAFAALRYHSLACGLLAGLAASAFALTFVDKVFNPSGIDTFRWILFLLVLGFAAAAAYLRQGPRPGFATQAVNLAGLMLLGLAATFLAAAAVSSLRPFGGTTASLSAGFGWKAVMILGSLAVIAYAAVERERGPGYIGFLSLLFAIVIVANPTGDHTIVGWPLVLLLAAGAAFWLGLAPRSTGGPSPGAGPGPAPPPAADTREPPPAS